MQLVEDRYNIFCVMELLAKPLTRLVTGRNRVNEDKARYIVRQICLAINFIHSRGIAHRDLKPDNVMIDDETHDLKLIDFGFAGPIERDGKLHSETHKGTAYYMAPEI